METLTNHLPRKILVLDDDARLAAAIAAVLRVRNYLVVESHSIRDAQKVIANDPDVSLLLINMSLPDMDSYRFIRQLRSDKSLDHLWVIALFPGIMAHEAEKSMVLGADDVCPTPINVQLLCEKINRALNQSHTYLVQTRIFDKSLA